MDAGVLDAGSSFHFNTAQDNTIEENSLISKINSNGSDFFTDGRSNQFREDLNRESFTEFDDNNRLSLSFGSYHNGSSRSLTPSGSSELIDYQIADWHDHLGSLNTSDDEYDVVDVGDGGMFLNLPSGTSRMRCLSSSSLMGPCIPPDLIMESRDSEDFLNDSFNDLEDVQQQIYLEDIHRNIAVDDMLAPIDDCMDGASLQKELIDKLTGVSNPSSLAFDNNVGVTEGIESSGQRVNDEVKLVNATPGSENVSIDGMEVSLPAGSIVLAVVNESGSLVPYSVNPHTFCEEKPKLNAEVNYCLSAEHPQAEGTGSEPVRRNLIAYSPTELINHLEVTPNLKDTATTFKSNSNNNLVSVAEAAQIAKKLNFEENGNCDDIVDVESVSQSTPVLEASDLATLLYEFEASESVNKKIEEANNEAAFFKDIGLTDNSINAKNQDIKMENGILTECYNTTDSHSLHPILAKALEKVAECSSNQTRSSITITSTRPTIGGSSSTTTTSISIKVKKVDGKKPAKSLIERKNELMKKKLVAHQRIKDALPLEIIEKIRASGTRKTTKILAEALLPKFLKKRKLPKTKPLKRSMKSEKKVPKYQNLQSSENDCVTSVSSVFQEHDYCQRPMNIKTEIKSEFESKPEKCETMQECQIYDKIPDYCNSDVFGSEHEDTKFRPSLEMIEDFIRGNDMTIGNIKEINDNCVNVDPDSTSVYSRLPDYVTGIGSVDSKFEDPCSDQNTKGTPVEDHNELQPSQKPKKKLKLSEYRMRIQSNDNSRCSSPSMLEEKTIKGIKSEFLNSTTKTVKPNVVPSDINSTPLGVVAIDDSLKVKNNVYPTTITHFGVVLADDDECQFLEDKRNITTATELIAHGKENENIPKGTKDVIKVKRVSSLKSSKNRPQCMSTSFSKSDKSLNVNSSHLGSVSSTNYSSKETNVIEIDLEEGELDDNDGEDKIGPANKLALLSMLPLSKMPPSSLGHSLLYSRKIKNKQMAEELNVQKMQKVPSSSMSNSSITSSSSSLSPRRHNARTRKRDRSRSSSRSRSRSHSKKRSYKKTRSPKSSRLSSHRKSLRRWTRSRSSSSQRRSRSHSSHRRRSRSRTSHRSRSRSSNRRSCSRSSHRRSKSYSSSSIRSYSSRSRSRSYLSSSSSSSRSRSRSRLNRRKTRHSRRRYRSKDRYHSSSRSRSRCYEDRRKSYRDPYETPDWSFGSSRQPHMYTKHMSQSRNLTDVERDVEERKIIYCGCIEDGTSRAEFQKIFERFGTVIDSNIHFRENGDNYGFVTFRSSESAFQALENGKTDPLLSKYNLCFGGRRKFCKERYCDLDAQKDDYGYYNSSASMDYDTLLKTALNRHR